MSMEILILIVSFLIFIFLIDDLFIDYVVISRRLKPLKIKKSVLDKQNKNIPIAIMIANWKESDVIEAMVRGNFSRIKPDEATHVFLGVYPNDMETKNKAESLSQIFPHVHLVVNELEGPTFKGQMLNQILEFIFKYEKTNNIEFKGFVLHDSEDVLNTHQIQLYRYGVNSANFIQVPVFPIINYKNSFVGATYIDEFIEMHAKELLARQYLGAALPSAGVGTCLDRDLIKRFYKEHGGKVFLPNALTEDYNLGLQTKIWGYKSQFFCFYLENESCKNIISTREIFPQTAKAAIRQKSRWVTGIVFQGYQKFKWFGNFNERYFLWRDRKSVLGAFLTLFSLCILFYMLVENPQFSELMKTVLILNLSGFVIRVLSRIYFVTKYCSVKHGLLSVLRWPTAIYVNMCSGILAYYQRLLSQWTKKEIKWVKTEHKLPEGLEFASEESVANIHILHSPKKFNREKTYEI